ncbi:AGAP013095-PA-like protein [Anopheles sinensis]|uniref:AGAP013095-PA-like protein n=1 Tax=Anopheles sinensis TaxID=74873 RepID=A0A084WT18_ANOSI|nr:AGAP013095-PA-like protein [Anopheles sinensis]
MSSSLRTSYVRCFMTILLKPYTCRRNVRSSVGSRKRRPSYSQDDREYFSINDDDPMDECNAALVLMSLSCSPNSSAHGYDTLLGTSSGSSTTSWSTGSTSPPLSEDGHSTPPTHHHHHELNHHHHHHHHTSNHHNGRHHQAAGEIVRGARTTSLSTSDEGIGMEYNEDMPRKRRGEVTTWHNVDTCREIASAPGSKPYVICAGLSSSVIIVQQRLFYPFTGGGERKHSH